MSPETLLTPVKTEPAVMPKVSKPDENVFSAQNRGRTNISGNQTAVSAANTAVSNYAKSGGDISSYLVETSGRLYVLVPMKAQVVETKGPQISNITGGMDDCSGTQGRAGFIELIKSVEREVAAGAIKAGTRTVYGFNGISKDIINDPRLKNENGQSTVRQVIDGKGNAVSGMIEFNYSDGNELLNKLNVLLDIKDKKGNWNVGSTPDNAGRENTLRNMVNPTNSASKPGESVDAYLSKAGIKPVGQLGSFVQIAPVSSYMFSNGEKSYLPIKGKAADGTIKDYVVVKDDKDRLTIFEKGGVYRERQDGTYNDCRDDGKANFKTRQPEQDEGRRYKDQMAFMDVFGITPLITVKRVNDKQEKNVDPAFDQRLKTIGTMGQFNMSLSFEAELSKSFTCAPDYSKAKLVSEKEYYNYTSKKSGQVGGVSTEGSQIIVSGQGKISASAEAYLPIDIKLEPRKSIVVLDWSGSTSYGMQRQAAEKLSKIFNVTPIFPAFDGSNTMLGEFIRGAKNSSLEATEKSLKVNLAGKFDDNLQDYIDQTRVLSPPVKLGSCKPTAAGVTKLLGDNGISLTEAEVSRAVNMKNNQGEAIPYMFERVNPETNKNQVFAVTYDQKEKVLQVAEVSTVTIIRKDMSRIDIIKEDKGWSAIRRSADFDDHRPTFSSLSSHSNTDVYVSGDWGNQKVTADPETFKAQNNSIYSLWYGSSPDNKKVADNFVKKTNGKMIQIEKGENMDVKIFRQFTEQFVSNAISAEGTRINTFEVLPVDVSLNNKSGTVNIKNPLLSLNTNQQGGNYFF